MTNDAYIRQIREALENRQLGRALETLESLLIVSPQQNAIAELNELKENYRLMTGYWRRGYKDPQLSSQYEKLLDRLSLLAANVSYGETIRQSAFLSSLHAGLSSAHRDWSPEAVRKDLEDFVSDVALLELDPEHIQARRRTDLYAAHQRQMSELFRYILLSPMWTEQTANAYLDILLSPTIDRVDQQIIVSAVMLSVICSSDAVKRRLLLQVYQKSADEHVRQRALVSWAMLFTRADMPQTVAEREMVEGMLADEVFVKELTELQIQMIYCVQAEKDSRKIQEEIMPDLLKNSNFRVTQSGIEEKEDDPMEDLLHPEESERKMELLEASYQKMMNMQKAGSDIYFGGFSQMKRFPFFSEISNWFTPFYEQHPAVSQMLHDNKTARLLQGILKTLPFCNSDKYSFAIAFQRTVHQLPANLLEALERGEVKIAENPDGEELTPALIRRGYLQDLYRFFRLNPHRDSFDHPFVRLSDDDFLYFPFFGNTVFHHPLLSHAAVEVASLLVKRKMTEQADSVLLNFLGVADDTDYDMLLGHRLLGHPDTKGIYPVTAKECFESVLSSRPDQEKAILGYARALFVEKDYTGAAAAYDRLITLNPRKESYQLNKAVCLTNLSDYEEALKLLYQLNYNHPDDGQVNHVLAWTLTCNGKLEQADRLYQKINGAFTDDGLNHGYCLWLMGKIEDAILAFRSYREATGRMPEDFLWDERALLERNGIGEVDIRLMSDSL